MARPMIGRRKPAPAAAWRDSRGPALPYMRRGASRAGRPVSGRARRYGLSHSGRRGARARAGAREPCPERRARGPPCRPAPGDAQGHRHSRRTLARACSPILRLFRLRDFLEVPGRCGWASFWINCRAACARICARGRLRLFRRKREMGQAEQELIEAVKDEERLCMVVKEWLNNEAAALRLRQASQCPDWPAYQAACVRTQAAKAAVCAPSPAAF
jgi:hypothetical protein